MQLHNSSLRTINLGDSGFLLCRLRASESDGDDGDARKWHVVYEAPHQSHYFNCPYQLGFNNGDMVRRPPDGHTLIALLFMLECVLT